MCMHVHFELQAIQDIILQGHKQAFVWMDEWYGKCACSPTCTYDAF